MRWTENLKRVSETAATIPATAERMAGLLIANIILALMTLTLVIVGMVRNAH